MTRGLGNTVMARLHERLESEPKGKALAFYKPSGRGQVDWIDFATVVQNAAASAAALRDLGCGAGAVCIIVLPSGPAAARLVLAAILNGSLPLLIAPPSILGTGSDLTRVLRAAVRRTGARLLICPESMASGDSELAALSRTTRVVFGEPGPVANASVEELPRKWGTATDLVALQLTSGTTGLPKICAWNNEGVVAAIDGMAAMTLSIDDILFNWTPLYHDMGLVNNYFTSLLTGRPLVLMNPHDFVKTPTTWLRGLSDTKATVTWSPNFGFALVTQRAKAADLEGINLEHVRSFWNAAERVHLETLLAFQERFSSYGVSMDALKTNFGCAENIGGATFTEDRKPFTYEYVDRESLLERRLAQVVSSESSDAVPVVGVGIAHPKLEVSIVSPRGSLLPDGQVGEIALDTPSCMVGYLGDPRSTERALAQGQLRTGDLGYLRDGELFWVGRVKERINVRGRKLDPSDFEPILFEIEGLRKGCFVAFGVDDPETGTQRVVVASEVGHPNAIPSADLKERIARSILERLGLSVEVLLVPSGTLVKTSSGKRRHRHFRQAYEQGILQTKQIREAE